MNRKNGFSAELAIVFVMLLSLLPLRTSYAQGTVNFSNLSVPGNVNAPVFLSDGVTALSGPQFMAELLAGSSVANLSSIATVGFFTASAAGYFNSGSVAIPGVNPGTTAWIEVRVWNTANGASFFQAQASALANSWWQSSIFSVITGNIPTGAGPSPPAPLTGLGTSPVYLNSVPEPATTALLGLGFAVLFIRYRRWKLISHTLVEPVVKL